MASKKITDDQIKKCHKKGMTIKEMSTKYKLSRSALSQRFQHLGIKPHRIRLKGGKRSEKVIKHYTIHPRVISMVDEIAKREGKKKGVVVEEAIEKMYLEICI